MLSCKIIPVISLRICEYSIEFSLPYHLQPIDTIRELAFENGDIPVGSFSDNFYKATKLSTNPNLMKLAETYQTHYDFGKAFENATKGIMIMAEAGLFLEYNIRAGFTDK